MAKLTKRVRAQREKVEAGKLYPVGDAINLVQEVASAKFAESVDVCVNLGIDSRKSDQNVRGSTVLPNGTGKSVKVAVFTQEGNHEKAKAAGADIVGLDDLAEEIKAGNMDFDVLIATPDAMPQLAKLGPVLGPKGLMPNPKTGTVTPDVEGAVKNAKAGQVQFRTDKGGIIHATIGKANFDSKALEENLAALIEDLKKAKPANAKGVYLKKITLSTTMGPGIQVDQSAYA